MISQPSEQIIVQNSTKDGVDVILRRVVTMT